MTFLEVQSRSVDYGKKDPIETGLVNIYRSGVNARGCLDATAHEMVKRRALFSSGSGRDVRGVKEETQERSFASTLRTSNLVYIVRQIGREKTRFTTHHEVKLGWNAGTTLTKTGRRTRGRLKR